MQAVRDILGRLAVLDVETTGLDPESSHVIEVGVLFVTPGAPPQPRRWLVRPPGPVPPWITALTGLDDGALSQAPPFGAIEGELRTALAGWTVVAHNAGFERSFLGPLLAQVPVVDSCVLTHLLYPELPSHALDALVRWAGVGPGAQHRALGDVEDTLKVLEVALERVLAEGRRAGVEAALAQLAPAATADERALVTVLERLRDATPAVGRPATPPEVCADERLVRVLEGGLHVGSPVGLEIERPGAVAAALCLATRAEHDDAVPQGRGGAEGLFDVPPRAVHATVRREAPHGRDASEGPGDGPSDGPSDGPGDGRDEAREEAPDGRDATDGPPTVEAKARVDGARSSSARALAGLAATPESFDGRPMVVAVPRRTLRELAPGSPLPVVQRRPTCRARLAKLLEQPASPVATGDERLARAYLAALLHAGPLLVPSSWFRARAPAVGALLREAGPCRCDDLACAGPSPAQATGVLVSHELALDWLEQRVPMALVVLDAERLPAAERHRTTVRVDAARLESAARLVPADVATRLLAHAAAVKSALTAFAADGGAVVDLRARVLSPWLKLRDVLTASRKDVTAWLAGRDDGPASAPIARLADELSRVAEPPPPGFEARVVGGDRPALTLEPTHPEVVVAHRLPGACVLVTGSRGGVEWAQRPTHHVGPHARPLVELEPCVASVGAVATHAGRLALTLGGPVNLLVEGPLEPLAEGVHEAFPRLAVRTVPGAAPPGGACVVLVPWPGAAPPEALATLVGPVRDVRRAVLACGAREVTVLTPAERWAEVEARLEDLRDDLGSQPGLSADQAGAPAR